MRRQASFPSRALTGALHVALGTQIYACEKSRHRSRDTLHRLQRAWTEKQFRLVNFILNVPYQEPHPDRYRRPASGRQRTPKIEYIAKDSGTYVLSGEPSGMAVATSFGAESEVGGWKCLHVVYKTFTKSKAHDPGRCPALRSIFASSARNGPPFTAPDLWQPGDMLQFLSAAGIAWTESTLGTQGEPCWIRPRTVHLGQHPVPHHTVAKQIILNSGRHFLGLTVESK